MKKIIKNIKFIIELWNINTRYCELDMERLWTDMSDDEYNFRKNSLDMGKEELYKEYKKGHYNILCSHMENIRMRKYFHTDGTPMIEFDCYDCGWHDNGPVYTNEWSEELVVKEKGKIILQETK